MADWTNLSQDLLRMISDISISLDHFRMQSVCKSWWSILKNSNIRELPWLMMLPKDKEEDPDAFDFFSLSKQKIFTIPLPEMRCKRCCGSFQNGWLMTMDIDLNICLFHPWSKKKLDLPHASTFKRQCYSVERCTMEEIRDICILKAALSDDANMVVVVDAVGNMAFCRVGDEAWTDIDSAGTDAYWEDVIYHKGRFYGLSQLAGVFLLRPEEGVDRHWVVERLTEDLELYFGLLYLVPDIFTDSMFMIVREVEQMDVVTDSMFGDAEHMDLEDDEEDPNPPRPRPRPRPRQPHRTVHFDIYKTPLGEGAPNEELNKWMKVDSLGDRIIFAVHMDVVIMVFSMWRIILSNNFLQTDFILPQRLLYGLQPRLIPFSRRDLGETNFVSPCFPSARSLALHSFSCHLPLFLVEALHFLKLQSAAINSSHIQSF